MSSAPTQTTRLHVRLVAAVNGMVLDEVMLVPAHQTVGWVVSRSGWLVAHPTLQSAVITRAGQVIPPTTPVQSGDVLTLAHPIAHPIGTRRQLSSV